MVLCRCWQQQHLHPLAQRVRIDVIVNTNGDIVRANGSKSFVAACPGMMPCCTWPWTASGSAFTSARRLTASRLPSLCSAAEYQAPYRNHE